MEGLHDPRRLEERAASRTKHNFRPLCILSRTANTLDLLLHCAVIGRDLRQHPQFKFNLMEVELLPTGEKIAGGKNK